MRKLKYNIVSIMEPILTYLNMF